MRNFRSKSRKIRIFVLRKNSEFWVQKRSAKDSGWWWWWGVVIPLVSEYGGGGKIRMNFGKGLLKLNLLKSYFPSI